MQLSRSSTPYNVPYPMEVYNAICNKPYSQINYPSKDCITPEIYPEQGKAEDTCRPFGYQPKRHGPIQVL